MQTWYPHATLNRATRDAGTFVDGYGWKLVVHTTESGSFTPSATSYFGHSSYPHFTCERDGRMWQHIPINKAARALRGAPTVQTNRGRAIQVECVGRSSADPDDILTDLQVAALQSLWQWLGQQVPVAQRAVPAGKIPGSASERAPQRMTPGQWRTFSGICGHRHVPSNEHWDPGAFDLSRLLTPPDDPEEYDVMASKAEIKDALREVLAEQVYLGQYGSKQWVVSEVARQAVHIRSGEDFDRLLKAFSHKGTVDLSGYEVVA